MTFCQITLKFENFNFSGAILQIQLNFYQNFWQILIKIVKLGQTIMKINNYSDIKFILIENFQC